MLPAMSSPSTGSLFNNTLFSADDLVHKLRSVRLLPPLALLCLILGELVFRTGGMHGFLLGVTAGLLFVLTPITFSLGRSQS